MEEIYNYLKECGIFYLATCEGEMPHVRPFGAVSMFEQKLYIVTNNKKDVFDQMQKNANVEISGMNKGTWLRLNANVTKDERREARVAMLEENETSLGKMYSADDELMEVFYLKNVTATICSFTEAPKVVNF